MVVFLIINRLAKIWSCRLNDVVRNLASIIGILSVAISADAAFRSILCCSLLVCHH